MPSLVVVRGTLSQQKFELGAGPIVLGRSAQCDLVIDDVNVSRQHAQTFWREGKFYIEDLSSRKETFVNSRSLKGLGAVELRNSDTIRICDTVLRFSGDLEPVVFERPVLLWDRCLLVEYLFDRHVNLIGDGVAQLRQLLLEAESDLSQQLQSLFHTIIVLDGAHGLQGQGRFQIDDFLYSSWLRIAARFEALHALDEPFRREWISELLADSEPALFCVFGVEWFGREDLGCFRDLGFTGGRHRVIYCGENRALRSEMDSNLTPSPSFPDTAM